jgi:hypothetical protein
MELEHVPVTHHKAQRNLFVSLLYLSNHLSSYVPHCHGPGDKNKHKLQTDITNTGS